MAESDGDAEITSRLLRGPTVAREPSGGRLDETLRARKKRLTRQLISDTATALFLQHGFDEVRVADVAEASGVSEKTVYNYFPTKESLLFDREPEMVATVRRALGPDAPDGSPVEALVAEIRIDVEAMTRWWAKLPTDESPAEMLQRFWELVEATPALRAAEHDMMDRVTRVAAEELSARAGVDPLDPEPQVAAAALCALWPVTHRAMRRHAVLAATPDKASAAILDEVRRAARLIDTGLWSFGLEVQGTPSAQQFKQAAEAAAEARTQVIDAVRAAKVAWREFAEQARAMHGHAHGPTGDVGHGPMRGGPGGRGPRGSRGPRGPRGPRGRSDVDGDGFDAEALLEAREGMRKARRDLIAAKREAQEAVRQVKTQIKDERTADAKPKNKR